MENRGPEGSGAQGRPRAGGHSPDPAGPGGARPGVQGQCRSPLVFPVSPALRYRPFVTTADWLKSRLVSFLLITLLIAAWVWLIVAVSPALKFIFMTDPLLDVLCVPKLHAI